MNPPLSCQETSRHSLLCAIVYLMCVREEDRAELILIAQFSIVAYKAQP